MAYMREKDDLQLYQHRNYADSSFQDLGNIVSRDGLHIAKLVRLCLLELFCHLQLL